MSDVTQYFIARSRAFSRFQETGDSIEGRRCSNCIRWRFSFPDACTDALPMGSKDGSRCLNWADSMEMVRKQERGDRHE